MNVPVNPTYHEIFTSDFYEKWKKKKSENYKIYRKKWVKNPKEFILDKAPLHLDIEPTNACNLKCPMCPRTVLINDNTKEGNFEVGTMDMSLFKRIIDEAADIGVYSIKLNWLGEPLIHPNIVDMVYYAKSKGIIDVMLNTNGVLLTEQLSKDLIEAGLDKIFFSFDSPYKNEYENIRIGANYEQVLNNILTLKKCRENLNKLNPLTRVSMVINDIKTNKYNDYINLFRDLVDIIAYVEYRNPIGTPNNKKANKVDFACSQLWQRMFIAWNGDVIPCCVDSEKELLIANLKNDCIIDIWHGENYKNLRQLHRNGEWWKINRCKNCDLPYKTEDGTTDR